MADLRPGRPEDAEMIIFWISDKEFCYQWCAGLFGPYHPLSAQEFSRKAAAHLPYTYSEADRARRICQQSICPALL